MIIVFEGLDNAGKTTLAEKLEVSLIKDGYDVNYTREFQTPVGLLIKELYGQGKMDATMKSYLFAADRHMRLLQCIGDYRRSERWKEEIKSKVIIFDRYYQSAVAYRKAEGIDANWIEVINSIFPEPDLAFYLDITPETSISRNSDAKFNFIYSKEFLGRVREQYLSMNMIKIDGENVLPDDLFCLIEKMIKKHLTACKFPRICEDPEKESIV